ncbi:MAG: hypothetical protein IKF14_06805 [Atopobiaceae bacterium]|nr:hypothetical protein [Atopobiaceae bacterium]
MPEVTEAIDVKEQALADRDLGTLKLLLMDHATLGNLRWATDDYTSLGEGFDRSDELTVERVTGGHAEVIRPRVAKTTEEQKKRTRARAEVFTPAWVCNVQNNLVDAAWFGRDPGFNIERRRSWDTCALPVIFDGNRTWRDYVTKNVLEVACGEAPYITTRYDVSTGQEISVPDRVGLLDRKLRVVSENVAGKREWLEWAERAVKSCYAYDYQGDNVLLARENVLAAVEDAYEWQFGEKLLASHSRRFAEIIVWNVWQMDGLTGFAPYAIRAAAQGQLDLGDSFDSSTGKNYELVPCVVYDWDEGRPIDFSSLVGRTPR